MTQLINEQDFLKRVAEQYGFEVVYSSEGDLIIKSINLTFYWNDSEHTFEDFFEKLADFFGE